MGGRLWSLHRVVMRRRCEAIKRLWITAKWESHAHKRCIRCTFVLKSGLNTQCDVLPAWLVVLTFSTLGSPVSNGDMVNVLFCSFSYFYLNFRLVFDLTWIKHILYCCTVQTYPKTNPSNTFKSKISSRQKSMASPLVTW